MGEHRVMPRGLAWSEAREMGLPMRLTEFRLGSRIAPAESEAIRTRASASACIPLCSYPLIATSLLGAWLPASWERAATARDSANPPAIAAGVPALSRWLDIGRRMSEVRTPSHHYSSFSVPAPGAAARSSGG